jgi:hypothetical protein
MLKEENLMFQKTDFWIGLAVGAVAGIFGYRFMQEREQQMAAMQQSMLPAGQVPLAELQRQKEELEDMIAAQEAAQAQGGDATGADGYTEANYTDIDE